ncbi:hypothetical protein C452_01815 [Haloferax volcanii JCM 10717]|uniref:Uncharacterized protein n=1 Tax=Haloferax volcanii JCM 10717 TaxID=1227458 RepID=M0IGH4_HALVO|nr:hypothetical protein D320_14273 [Haloferax sp. BAB-2207]ELZ94529.1 hypothetical protein C452_01815 [Haloferax alexandrinus JCM 10717]
MAILITRIDTVGKLFHQFFIRREASPSVLLAKMGFNYLTCPVPHSERKGFLNDTYRSQVIDVLQIWRKSTELISGDQLRAPSSSKSKAGGKMPAQLGRFLGLIECLLG